MKQTNKEILFLVGNGYNYFIKDYLNFNLDEAKAHLDKSTNQKHDTSDINRWIEDLQIVLDSYCKLLDPITIRSTDKLGESFLSELYYFYNNLYNSDTLIEELEKSIIQTIKNIMGTAEEKSHSLPELTVRNILKVQEKHLTCFNTILKRHLKANKYYEIPLVYTTNYDHFVESLFDSKDSFVEVVHLHGKYDSESIICCPPEKKKNKTKKELTQFEEDLKRVDTIILFGISLECDPHIRELINSLSSKKIIIIDNSAEQYLNKRGYGYQGEIGKEYSYLNPINNNLLYFIETKNNHIYNNNRLILSPLTPKQLLDKLDQILKDSD